MIFSPVFGTYNVQCHTHAKFFDLESNSRGFTPCQLMSGVMTLALHGDRPPTSTGIGYKEVVHRLSEDNPKSTKKLVSCGRRRTTAINGPLVDGLGQSLLSKKPMFSHSDE
jgi:hypothetical protein